MALTFQALEGTNSVSAAEISITITPTDPIFTEINWVGNSTDSGIINIENNNEDMDVHYFISADWHPPGTSTPQDARLLAERLNIKVTADPEDDDQELYDGVLAGLIQQPSTGRLLDGGADEDVEFELNLPIEAATDLIQGMSIEFDLIFVAVTD